MTVAEWLAVRTPRPPAALAQRIAEMLGDAAQRDATEATDVLLAAGERLVASLLAEGSTMRASALDLLTADALVTYAFEAAAATPAVLGERAASAMSRIAETGARLQRELPA